MILCSFNIIKFECLVHINLGTGKFGKIEKYGKKINIWSEKSGKQKKRKKKIKLENICRAWKKQKTNSIPEYIRNWWIQN